MSGKLLLYIIASILVWMRNVLCCSVKNRVAWLSAWKRRKPLIIFREGWEGDGKNIAVELLKVKDVYKEIVEYMAYQKSSGTKETFRTREVADAVGLTIYQTRLHLEALQSLDVVEKINSGKGVPGIWRLRWKACRYQGKDLQMKITDMAKDGLCFFWNYFIIFVLFLWHLHRYSFALWRFLLQISYNQRISVMGVMYRIRASMFCVQ